MNIVRIKRGSETHCGLQHFVCRTYYTFFVLLVAVSGISGQTTDQTTSSSNERLEVTASTEFGVRGLDVNGSENKFRSDLNYKRGFRLFDSSVLIEDKSNGPRAFDSMMLISSGWGADPTGFLRMSIERSGKYRFDSSIRRVSFFNSLSNHALNQHNADTRRNFGDFDLTILPENPKYRFRVGYSFNVVDGDAGFNTRAFGDEFPVTSFVRTSAHDFRVGSDWSLLGFNMSFTYGYRHFSDDTRYISEGLNLGNNPTNNARLFTFERSNPVDGHTHHGILSVQRTFANRFDITGRIIHSETETAFSLFEMQTGRDNSNNQVDSHQFRINGDAKRPQTRGDLGMTLRVTKDFRISNTFNFDNFNVTGGNLYAETLFSRTAAGAPRPTTFVNTLAHRLTRYRRYVNTLEADYQYSNRLGFNAGYRFTHRQARLDGFDRNFASANPVVFTEDFDNSTNTFLAGMKVKPMKNWAIFWDLETGKADNVFTRLANYEFTNFRVRNRVSLKKVSLNLSFILKDNENPGRSVEVPPVDFRADTQSRVFSGQVDWTPIDELSLSGGYTYNHLTSETAIIVPVAGVRRQGISQFFIRDHYAFIDVHARPHKRLSLFGSYRFNNDRGQRDLLSTLPENIITSYPMEFKAPEFRAAIRLTRNIDWNLGYQYFDFSERFTPTQNYRSHLPYTSLRIYFGRAAGDR